MKKSFVIAMTFGLMTAFALSNPVQAQNQADMAEKKAKESFISWQNDNDGAGGIEQYSKSMKKAGTLSAEGTIPCKNGKELSYKFAQGKVTISGEGDEPLDNKIFQDNDSVIQVEFAKDCKVTNIASLFSGCEKLADISNLPDTIYNMNSSFAGCKALKHLPKLPSSLKYMTYSFTDASFETIDFSMIPSTVVSLDGAFKRTTITSVNMKPVIPRTDSVSYAYTFADCENLKTVTIDASALNDGATLWLQGICEECPELTSFQLINTPTTNEKPGSDCCKDMFHDCPKLETVKLDGYFNFSIGEAFSGCVSLRSIESRGIQGLYSKDSLSDSFMDCKSLTGNYYISPATNYAFYDTTADNTAIAILKDTFTNCAAANFYIGSEKLVTYYNGLKTAGTLKTSANIIYWAEGDNMPLVTPAPTKAPIIAPSQTTPTTPTIQKARKTITTFKLTKYKKNTKKIVGKTIKKAKVVVKIGKKKYSTKANAKGSFTIKLKQKLKKNNKVKVTISKSGYLTKTKTFKVK